MRNSIRRIGYESDHGQCFFLRQSLRVGGFPFDVKLEQPNNETIYAMREAERIARDPSVKRYSDVEQALMELKR